MGGRWEVATVMTTSNAMRSVCVLLTAELKEHPTKQSSNNNKTPTIICFASQGWCQKGDDQNTVQDGPNTLHGWKKKVHDWPNKHAS